MNISSVWLLLTLTSVARAFHVVGGAAAMHTPNGGNRYHSNQLATRFNPRGPRMMCDASDASDGENVSADEDNNAPSSAVMEDVPASATSLTLMDKASDLAIALFGVYILLTVTGFINPYGLDK